MLPTSNVAAFAAAASLFVQAGQHLGVRPIPGAPKNPIIMGWWQNLGWEPPQDDTISPCSVALSAWAVAAGAKSAQSPYPQDWLTVGEPIPAAMPGAVAVMQGNPGHVGIVFAVRPYGATPGPEVSLLGAGQDWPDMDGINQVTISGWTKVTNVRAFRWIFP